MTSCSFASIIEVIVAHLPPCLPSMKLKLLTTRDHAVENYIRKSTQNTSKDEKIQGVYIYEKVVLNCYPDLKYCPHRVIS